MADADFVGTVFSVSAVKENADGSCATFSLYVLTQQPPDYVGSDNPVFGISAKAQDAQAMIAIATAAFVSGQRLKVGLVTPWELDPSNKMVVAWMQLELLKPRI